MRPLISVCIPAYNVENYIGECLNSIINQPFGDYEIVLIDNGSDDKTPEICETFAKRYPSIITFEALEKPTRLGRAALRAITLARGDYVISVDSDDYLSPNALAEIGKAAYEKNSDLIMIDYECIAEEGLAVRNNPSFDAVRINEAPYFDAIRYITGQNTFLASMWMYAIKNDERFHKIIAKMQTDENINGDTYYVLYLFISHKSIYYIDKKLYFYRLRHGSLSTVVKSNRHVKGLFYAVIELMTSLSYESDIFSTEDLIAITYTLLLRYFKISLSDYEHLESADMEAIANKFDNLIDKLGVIVKLEYPLFKILYENILKYGGRQGLEKTIEYENRWLINRVKQLHYDELYVVPTGSYGENALSVIKNNGFRVSAFLDNGETKINESIGGIPCLSPNILKDKLNKADIAVVIASAYESHTESIKNQILSLGIPVKNIIVRSELS